MWKIQCVDCGRGFHSNLAELRVAEVSARRNGWHVGTVVRCPSCACAEDLDEHAEQEEAQHVDN